MITSIFKNSSWQNNSGIAHVLSRIDFKKFNNALSVATWHQDHPHTIVLFEYIHSGIYDEIAEMERIPGTTQFIHDFLKDPEVENVLKSLFADKPNMLLFSRRKIDNTKSGSESLTKYRQYVLKICPEMPSPILNPEDDDEDYADMPALEPAWKF